MITPQQAKQILLRLRKPLSLHEGYARSVAEDFEFIGYDAIANMGINFDDIKTTPGFDGIETVHIGGGRHITAYVFQRSLLTPYAGMGVVGVGRL